MHLYPIICIMEINMETQWYYSTATKHNHFTASYAVIIREKFKSGKEIWPVGWLTGAADGGFNNTSLAVTIGLH